MMEDLRLPPPFAFNYHYDNGTFRGLSFANYRNANDAALTVSALNGFDLQVGRFRFPLSRSVNLSCEISRSVELSCEKLTADTFMHHTRRVVNSAPNSRRSSRKARRSGSNATRLSSACAPLASSSAAVSEEEEGANRSVLPLVGIEGRRRRRVGTP